MKRKTMAAILGVTILASMGTGAYAATKLQEIKAYLNPDIKVTVDGTPVQLRDAKGNVVVPITYNDANYIPAKAIADALGVAVDYDAASRTVIFGNKTEGTAISVGFKDMYHTKDPDLTVYKGKDYKEVYYNNGTGNRSASFMLYPKKQHQTLQLQIAAIGQDLEELVIQDADKNIVLKEVPVIKVEDGLTTVEVNIAGVNTLYVYASAKKDGAVFVPLTTSQYK
ncbi:stalk domain-containing protein [Paenibacillus fonticola]|uniref:stalk domain-containing protein n=1 Tax=Paenibacillus fonticola TaxID=379896 RepID=UPI00037F1895|nr:stalk domain-containing protein [Paenibacillus fonticola]